jgi:hypothetical protein
MINKWSYHQRAPRILRARRWRARIYKIKKILRFR